MEEIKKTYKVGSIINQRSGESTPLDVFDLVAFFRNSDSDVPLSPIDSTVIVDLTEDNQAIEVHLDKHFLDSIDVEVPLAVKRPDSKQHRITLDGAEVELLKGLRFWYEFELFGDRCIQSNEIHFTKEPTSANLVAGPAMPDPALFKNIIIPLYDKTTNELYLETNGSAIPDNIKIIDVIGLL